MTHRRRRLIALLALLGLLFQQLAMAAYVCPIDSARLQAASADVPPCHRPHATDRTRCHTHCHPQSVSSDHPPLPTVPAAMLPATTWWRAAAWQPQLVCADVAGELTARATAPPLTIRHCTLQI